jgi:hypothetical protein
VVGCGWPEAAALTVGDWASGYHEILLRGSDGAEARHMLVVKAPRPAARAVIVLATNTYHAYNWWGGANTYAWVGGPEPAPPPADLTVAARLSAERPFAAGLMRPASPDHRIVTRARRGFRERPSAGEVLDEVMAGGQGWDCPAGFVDKWEHAFVAWAEEHGYALDYLTDADLETEPDALAGYRLALFVGHSEYWSFGQRTAVERFVDRGGRVAIFSGNTCYWQCRWEDGGRTFVAYKARAEREDPVAADPARRHLASGLWSSPTVARPEAALTGLSFLLGGYHRFGLCVSRGIAGYTVWRDDHWALAGADLFYGGRLRRRLPPGRLRERRLRADVRRRRAAPSPSPCSACPRRWRSSPRRRRPSPSRSTTSTRTSSRPRRSTSSPAPTARPTRRRRGADAPRARRHGDVPARRRRGVQRGGRRSGPTGSREEPVRRAHHAERARAVPRRLTVRPSRPARG